MVRKSLFALLVVLALGAVATPAQAQSMLVNFNVGAFRIPTSDRAAGDIITTELNGGGDFPEVNQLAFNIHRFNNATFGVDFLFAVGDYLEAGVGVNYYASTVPSVSANFTHPPAGTGSEIQQTLRLRIAPLTATVRFLPLGKNAVVEPYVGGGVAVMFWRYTEEGEFLNSDLSTFTTGSTPFVGTGTTVGPTVLGGLRVPFGRFVGGFEVRWQKGTGTLNLNDFLSDKIDLGGMTYQATFGVRF